MRGKSIILLTTIVALAAVGFAVGRMSGIPVSLPEQVKRVFPSLPIPPKDEDTSDKSDNPQSEVLIEVPAEDELVGRVFDVVGRFLNDGRSLRVILKDSDGESLSETKVVTLSSAESEYGRFKATISLPQTIKNRAVIEVVSSMPDGSISGPDAVRVVELIASESFDIKIYFSNKLLDPAFSCTQTYPVERTVQSEGQPYQAALESLLAGPTKAEKERGYLTELSADAEVLSVLVNSHGQAIADFSKEVDQGVAGSCLVSTIRSQIESTLSQFPEIKEVIISVEGDSEESLQP